ncbi:MAG: hypothetical protein LUG18_09965 [Candidatus Azobacteroides sp.]|nr:hypothetical protein [Candidatus Azobacteroides sp.]
MAEKVVYAWEKYDIEKQKENIAQLKRFEPTSLKEANAQQKIKYNGKPHQNNYKW